MNINDKILTLHPLEPADEAAFFAYQADWQHEISPFNIYSVRRIADIRPENFAEFAASLRKEEVEAPRPELSIATTYYGFLDGQIIGVISCRWQIEKGDLLQHGGHIGYAVAPSFRGKRLAEQMVRLVLPEYRARGILRVLITAHDGNKASQRTIEAIGGQLENIVDEEGKKLRRYWIDLDNIKAWKAEK